MTDKLSNSELVEKTFVFISTLTRECRKALTAKFEHEHKGIALDSVEAVLKKEVEAWFAARDRNVKLAFANTVIGKPGDVRITYTGATKDARFKIHVDSLFTIVEPSQKAYLKSLNLNIDKREFTR